MAKILSTFVCSGFHVIYHFFGLEHTAHLEDLESKGQRFCDTQWDTIAAHRGAEIHVDHYCFRQAPRPLEQPALVVGRDLSELERHGVYSTGFHTWSIC